MTTKTDLIAQMKAENPTLKIGSDEDGYTQLSAAEYDATIEQWAEARLAKADASTQAATDKVALLAKLGITAEEAKLLLS